jgi:HlyD family secretion protein
MNKKVVIGVVGILVIGGLAWFILARNRSKAVAYNTAEIKRGDIESVVTSTGTLNAIVTVDVGTQVSGTVSKLYADFNQKVSKGQPLAQLETDILNAAVRDAQANVEKARAQLAQAQDAFHRNYPMVQKGYLSASEFASTRANVTVAKSGLQSAQSALQRAQTNLGYALIRSPINGTVIQRNVDVGQTVAASLSTPTLFLIAEDLSRMQINATVDESDIGSIKQGQIVHFSVQAYPDKKYTGTVRQIRLQPTTTQNVVNYTVIIDADNPDDLLLPGMTATVDFEVQTAHDVLYVPNAALRFQPPAEVLAEYQKRRGTEGTGDSAQRAARRSRAAGTTGGTGTDTARGGAAAAGRRLAGGGFPAGMRQLWYLDSTGQINAMPVHTGITDGQNTEVSGSRLTDGMKVITSVVTQASSSTTTTSPLTPQRVPGGGGRGGAGGIGGGR